MSIEDDFKVFCNVSQKEVAHIYKNLPNSQNIKPDDIKQWLTLDRIKSCFPNVFKRRIEKGNYKCPFHDDSSPSLQINEENGYFKCYGCGKKGSFIDLYGYLINSDLESKDRYKVALEYYKSSNPQIPSSKKDYHLVKSFSKRNELPFDKHLIDHEEKCKLFTDILNEMALDKQALDYLIHERKLTKETIVNYRIKSVEDVCDFFLNSNVNQSLLEKYLLLYQRKYFQSNFPSDCIVFPHIYGSQVYYLSNRIYHNKPDETKTKNIKGVSIKYFPGNPDMSQFDTVLLFEGVLDGLSYYELTKYTNFYATIGLPSAIYIKGLLENHKHIILALDDDERGLQRISEIMNNINNPEKVSQFDYKDFCKKLKIEYISGQDMNDILKRFRK